MTRTCVCGYFYFSPRKDPDMTCKNISQHKEIAMGVASKAETAPKGAKVINKKCGGKVKKAPLFKKK